MTERTFFEALVFGAYLVALVVFAHMAVELGGWFLRNWPADGPKQGE